MNTGSQHLPSTQVAVQLVGPSMWRMKVLRRIWPATAGLLTVLLLVVSAGPVVAAPEGPLTETCTPVPFWVWPAALFAMSFALGVVAVLGGVGGGVLFVPVVGGFFPFHMDFVRCAGLLVALSCAVAASPRLLRNGLTNLRLAIPLALIASCSSIAGAMMGLALPGNTVQTILGLAILGIAMVMLLTKKSEYPLVPQADRLSQALGIYGIYHEASTGQDVPWKIHRTPLGMVIFIGIGIMAGMLGLGAGWANVPVLNLVMGAPLKLSVANSLFILSVTDSTAAWVYINNGAALPIILVPSIIGIMLGSLVGVRLLARIKPKGVRWFVLGLLLFAGLRALLKGLGVWN